MPTSSFFLDLISLGQGCNLNNPIERDYLGLLPPIDLTQKANVLAVVKANVAFNRPGGSVVTNNDDLLLASIFGKEPDCF